MSFHIETSQLISSVLESNTDSNTEQINWLVSIWEAHRSLKGINLYIYLDIISTTWFRLRWDVVIHLNKDQWRLYFMHVCGRETYEDVKTKQKIKSHV